MKPQKTSKFTSLSSSKLAKQNSFKLFFFFLIRNSNVIKTSVDPFVTTYNKFYFEGKQIHPLQIIDIMMNLLRYFSKSTCNLDRAKYRLVNSLKPKYVNLILHWPSCGQPDAHLKVKINTVLALFFYFNNIIFGSQFW